MQVTKRLTVLVALVTAACGNNATTTDVTEDTSADGAVDAAGTDAQQDSAQTDAAAGTDALADTAGTDAAPGTDAIADTGPDVPDVSGTDAASDTSAAPYSAVQAVFDNRCITCHSATALGLPGYAKLPLTSDVSYQNLVNKPANETCGGTLVVPGKPDQSYLWQKLTAVTPCEGGHMPAKYEMLPSPPLSAEQLAAIQSWIAGGALP
jgi:hypothetical protein